MKHKIFSFLTIAFLVGIRPFAFSQTTPSYIDWVKTSQTYVQIKIAKDGIYRLDSNVLSFSSAVLRVSANFAFTPWA